MSCDSNGVSCVIDTGSAGGCFEVGIAIMEWKWSLTIHPACSDIRESVRLVVTDHISSNYGIVFPVKVLISIW